jgi:enoyl-CoA hydratase/carnithine racemase
MTAGAVTVKRQGDVALLTFGNPRKRNALDPALLGDLTDALLDLSAAGARAVVLAGEGAIFSAGYDIAALPEEPDDAWLRHHGPLGPALRTLAQVPTVAALTGPAIGSGCELALTCDLRVAHPGAVLQMPPVRMGLIYTPEGVLRLIALAGGGLAREMLLTARPVPADEALRAGLVNRVVPAEEVVPVALELAQEIARGAPLAVRGTKWLLDQLLLSGPALPVSVAEELARRRREAWASADAREARAAFRERRRPAFRGK